MMYHGTTHKIETFSGMTFVTPDQQAAIEYLEGEAGNLYTADFNAAIADEETAWEIIGEDSNGYRIFEYIEGHAEVVDLLTAAGFDGVAFMDETPDPGLREHETIVVFDGAKITITDHREIDEEEAEAAIEGEGFWW